MGADINCTNSRNLGNPGSQKVKKFFKCLKIWCENDDTARLAKGTAVKISW
ncbi:hypothetical protein HMPREF0277_0644 [Corynebacterium accolens ATCC 49726]|nr:hypothetical protein HMPREF0277_0644 [Corynebacterium accolens ATCC 49726]